MHTLKESLFVSLCVFSTCIGIGILLLLLIQVLSEGLPWIDAQFILSAPSRFPEQAGIYPQLLGSFFLILLIIILSVPLGVCTAIYLEEYAPKSLFTKILETNISNLAGVPSIVFGLLGLGIFVGFFGLGPGVLLVGALTLSLRILPIIIISAQEAIRAVPSSYKEAAYALGASQWETIKTIVLPQSISSIMTGIILAVSNAIGETAPLIMVGVATTTFRPPRGILSSFGALPLQIFAWSDYPKEEFRHGVTPAAIVILLSILMLCNISAVILRNRYNKKEI